jgi:hypothetical protein
VNSLPIEFADIVMFLTQFCIRSLLGCIRDRGRRDGETRGGGKDRKASSVRTGSSAELKLLKIAMLAAVLAKIAVVLLANAAGVRDKHLQRTSPISCLSVIHLAH